MHRFLNIKYKPKGRNTAIITDNNTNPAINKNNLGNGSMPNKSTLSAENTIESLKSDLSDSIKNKESNSIINLKTKLSIKELSQEAILKQLKSYQSRNSQVILHQSNPDNIDPHNKNLIDKQFTSISITGSDLVSTQQSIKIDNYDIRQDLEKAKLYLNTNNTSIISSNINQNSIKDTETIHYFGLILSI